MMDRIYLFLSNMFWRGQPFICKVYNYFLIKRFPFLSYKEGCYDFTWLDQMNDGWRKAFGIQMCTEIKERLIENDSLDEYSILEVKEKYGTLRWYDYSTVTDDIISKYEDLSSITCIKCGKQATYISNGWIAPFCTRCARKDKFRTFTPIKKS